MEMKKATANYPIFEANQVLTSEHLNDLREYLDEQERLTRANLIGIGIVCGLELQLDTATSSIRLTRGCGVTSEGYLIVEPEDVTLVASREYTLPDALEYRTFKDATADPKVQYPLWELFPAGEPDTTSLAAVSNFLDDKVVMLFMELKQESLRNCSPNNCNDRGAEVTATVRRLLVRRSDLDTIIAAAHSLGSGLTSVDLETALLEQMKLPDLRLPRYDVPNSSPVTSEQVLAAFQAIFQTDKLAKKTGGALTAAYNAFQPLLAATYPSSPLAGFAAKFNFLDGGPVKTVQVGFLQYYCDFFDDLLGAYDEFRWKGAGLMCACCPPEGLFPRHLMLGLASPDSNVPDVYRHRFVGSPVVSGCDDRVRELVLLFQRLVTMIERFTDTPPLPDAPKGAKLDPQIRITPSRWGDVPPSKKAIPYYYQQTGQRPLYQLWNPEKTRRNQANQNLGYRSDEYEPAAPAFVTDSLRFDLEPNNFLRIEGHLGKNVGSVLNTMLSLKSRYRLPIEIIALRTGAFDESMAIDLSKEDCRFQDLEALYDTLKAELMCFLCKEVQYFYGLPSNAEGGSEKPIKPSLPLLIRCAPEFMAESGTLGQVFEELSNDRRGSLFLSIFPGVDIPFFRIPNSQTELYSLTLSMSALSEQLAADLKQLDFGTFETRYDDLVRLAKRCERNHKQTIGNLEGNADLLSWEELDDRFEDILYHCRLDPFRALQDEHKRRVRELKQKQFFSYFLQNNPGIQHKAGVPLGGTFILVYHDTPELTKPGIRAEAAFVVLDVAAETTAFSRASTKLLSGALARLQRKGAYVDDPDIQVIFEELTGQKPVRKPALETEADSVYARAVDQLADGTVIADFFLPYLCCSDCTPVQYVLPPPPLTFTVSLGCTDVEGGAEATITPAGATANVYYQVDGGAFTKLTGHPMLAPGSHSLVIRDDTGAQSASQTVLVPEPLRIGDGAISEDAELKGYQVSFEISGGTAPYTADSGTVAGITYTSFLVPSGTALTVTITDHAGCTTTGSFEHTIPGCDLPCDGRVMRCGYLFWLPEPSEIHKLTGYEGEIRSFKIIGPNGETSLSGLDIRASVDDLNGDFAGTVQRWLDGMNAAIRSTLGVDDWFRLEYRPIQPGGAQMLVIEHFDCEGFREFEIVIDLAYQYGEFTERRRVVYTADRTVVALPGQESEIEILPLNCETANKCDAEPVWKSICEGVDFKPRMSKPKIDDNLTALLNVIQPSASLQYLWEVEDASPSVLLGPSVTTKVRTRVPPKKRVRLTAFDSKGCAVTIIGQLTVSDG